MSDEKLCRICGHPKSEHHIHIGPDHIESKVKHINCMVRVKVEYISDFLGEGNTMPIGHTCSCHGFKPNTYLNQAIRKYKKYLKTLPINADTYFKRIELKKLIKQFKNDIKENPKNLLHWQLEVEQK